MISKIQTFWIGNQPLLVKREVMKCFQVFTEEEKFLSDLGTGTGTGPKHFLTWEKSETSSIPAAQCRSGS